MNLVPTPRNKLLLALVATLVAGAAASTGGVDVVHGARWLLALGLIVVLAYWLRRTRRRPGEEAALPRLRIVERAALSQRSGVALVEADGRSYLVVHGDGFAHIKSPALDRPMHSASLAARRCPAPRAHKAGVR